MRLAHRDHRQREGEGLPCPTVDATLIVPPCASTKPLQIASPMPVPLPLRRPSAARVEGVEDVREVRRRDAEAWSDHTTRTAAPPSRSAHTAISALGRPLYFGRVLDQVGEHLARSPRNRSATGGRSGGRDAQRVRPEQAARAGPRRCRSLRRCRSTPSPARSAPPWMRERSSRLPTSRLRRSVSSSMAVGTRAAWRRPTCSPSCKRLVADALIEASGVRRSCETAARSADFSGPPASRAAARSPPRSAWLIDRQGGLVGEGGEQPAFVAENRRHAPPRRPSRQSTGPPRAQGDREPAERAAAGRGCDGRGRGGDRYGVGGPCPPRCR